MATEDILIDKEKLIHEEQQLNAAVEDMRSAQRNRPYCVLEFECHGEKRMTSKQHWKILQNQREHDSWNKVTPQLKKLYRYLECTLEPHSMVNSKHIMRFNYIFNI